MKAIVTAIIFTALLGCQGSPENTLADSSTSEVAADNIESMFGTYVFEGGETIDENGTIIKIPSATLFLHHVKKSYFGRLGADKIERIERAESSDDVYLMARFVTEDRSDANLFVYLKDGKKYFEWEASSGTPKISAKKIDIKNSFESGQLSSLRKFEYHISEIGWFREYHSLKIIKLDSGNLIVNMRYFENNDAKSRDISMKFDGALFSKK